MNCPIESRESEEILLAYCARKLDAGSSAMLEEHIKICPACREFAEAQESVWNALDAWEAAPLSPDFDRRLYARIEKEVSLWDRILRPFRPLLVRQGLPIAAAVGVVVMAGFLLDRPAGMNPRSMQDTSAVIEPVAPDQAEPTLQEMEMMRELNRLVHPENANSKI
jgi:anti-sigma factor RsiW